MADKKTRKRSSSHVPRHNEPETPLYFKSGYEPHARLVRRAPLATFTVVRDYHSEVIYEYRGEEAFRVYRVYGKHSWHQGTLARPLHLHDVFIVVLRFSDGKLVANALVPLHANATRRVQIEGVDELAEGELTLPLSGPEEDQELRHIAAYPLRLGAWAADRLGPILEVYLADHLKAD